MNWKLGAPYGQDAAEKDAEIAETRKWFPDADVMAAEIDESKAELYERIQLMRAVVDSARDYCVKESVLHRSRLIGDIRALDDHEAKVSGSNTGDK